MAGGNASGGHTRLDALQGMLPDAQVLLLRWLDQAPAAASQSVRLHASQRVVRSPRLSALFTLTEAGARASPPLTAHEASFRNRPGGEGLLRVSAQFRVRERTCVEPSATSSPRMGHMRRGCGQGSWHKLGNRVEDVYGGLGDCHQRAQATGGKDAGCDGGGTGRCGHPVATQTRRSRSPPAHLRGRAQGDVSAGAATGPGGAPPHTHTLCLLAPALAASSAVTTWQ